MCTQTKAAALMANIPQADIDPSGVFKYVLIRVHSKEEGDDSEVDIVRGYGWAEYHGESKRLNRSPPQASCGYMGLLMYDRQVHSVHQVTTNGA